MKAVRTGWVEELEPWLSPDEIFAGDNFPVFVTNAEGREQVLIWIFGLHQMASDIEIEVLGGWPNRRAQQADLRIQLSGVWRGRGGPFAVGEKFCLISTLSFEYAGGMITRLTQRH